MTYSNRNHYVRNQQDLQDRQQSTIRRTENYRLDKVPVSQQQYRQSQRILNERYRQTDYTSQSRRNRNVRYEQNREYSSNARNVYSRQRMNPYGDHEVHTGNRYNRPSSNRPVRRISTIPRSKESRPRPKLPQGKLRLLSVVVLLFILTWVVMLWVTPASKVNRLVIKGTELVNSDDIRIAAGIKPTDNVRDVIGRKQDIEKHIKTLYPEVYSITFKHNKWVNLELLVTEHKLVAKVEQSGQLVPLLDDGKNAQLRDVPIPVEQMQNIPLLVNFPNHGQMVEVTQMLRKVNPEILSLIESIQPAQEANKPHTIDVLMKDGNSVRAILSTFDNKIKYYPSIVQQINGQKGIINLEVGAYFTPYSSITNNIKLRTN